LNMSLFWCYTFVWILIYLCVFRGVEVIGKLSYITAIMPYFCLVSFFIKAVTLPNAGQGMLFYVRPVMSKLLDPVVWQKASTQIFYSLGVGWGSIVAFGSYADRTNDYIGHVFKVCFINCFTSVFAGFVVFSVLGFLTGELSAINPCFKKDDIGGLQDIGLDGSGLAFIAFPIAVAQMGSFKFFWAFCFFIMLFLLGLGSTFAMLESMITVTVDSGYGEGWQRWHMAAGVCMSCWLLGLIFITRAGQYWLSCLSPVLTSLGKQEMPNIQLRYCCWVGS